MIVQRLSVESNNVNVLVIYVQFQEVIVTPYQDTSLNTYQNSHHLHHHTILIVQLFIVINKDPPTTNNHCC